MALRQQSDATLLADSLIGHLSHKSGIVVAKATGVVLERQADLEPFVERLSPAMTGAFDRLLHDPVKTDPGCSGKIGIVNAGVALHCLDADLYLRAIHHVQMEGSFGPPIDTAESLRAAAAYGLLNCRHADAIYEIVDLLCEVDRRDPRRFPDSRRGAIRALGTVVGDTSAALLRMTARRFADDPDTLGETFASLNSIEAARSFDFIRGFLDERDADVRDIAALALAEGKQPGACAVLLEHVKQNLPQDPHAIYTALAITRKADAIEYLLDRLGNGRDREATAALEALQLMRHDEPTCQRIGAIVKSRGGGLVEAFRQWT